MTNRVEKPSVSKSFETAGARTGGAGESDLRQAAFLAEMESRYNAGSRPTVAAVIVRPDIPTGPSVNQ